MKTPVQELIEEYQQMRETSDSDMIVVIHLAKTMLEKEKEMMCDFAYNCRDIMAADKFAISKWYDKTFNQKSEFLAGNKYNPVTDKFKPQSYKLQGVDRHGEPVSLSGNAKQIITTLLNQHL